MLFNNYLANYLAAIEQLFSSYFEAIQQLFGKPSRRVRAEQLEF